MAQPSIPGTDVGRPVMLYGSDGNKWIALLVSNLGRLKVELASLPTGAVTIADGDDVTLGALADALVAAGAVGSVSAKLRRLTTDLDALLTELELKANLTDTQPVESKDGDKIFGFESILAVRDSFTLKDASTIAISEAVPDNMAWLVSAVSVRNNTRALTFVWGGVLRGELEVYIFKDDAGAAQYVTVPFIIPLYLAAGDKIFFIAGGGLDNDAIYISYTGYQMNAP